MKSNKRVGRKNSQKLINVLHDYSVPQNVAFTHLAWIEPNKLVEINHDSLIQKIWFLWQSVLLLHSSNGLKFFHFSQKSDKTRVILSVNIHTTCTMGGLDIGQLSSILEGDFKIQMLFCGTWPL